jgi:outer membrane protein TolC
MGKDKLKVKREDITSYLFRFIFLTLTVVNFLPNVNATPISLSLNQAIQRMIENNLSFKNIAYDYETAKMQYESAWNTFFLPSFTLTAGTSTSSNYTVGTLPGTAARNDPNSVWSRGYPTTGVTLSMGSYTLFNFFKDRGTYDIAKMNYDRASSVYQESIRTARFALIRQYFEVKIAQEKLEAAERSMTISQAISELIESRKSLGKATEDEMNSSSVDLLTARKGYGDQKQVVDSLLIGLNTTLNATPETEFKLTTQPPFIPVHLDEKELYEIFKTKSPSAKSAELALASAEISTANMEKTRLPLPVVTFSGVNIGYTSGYSGGTGSAYTNSSGGGTLDVSAAVSVTLPIFGPSGFFNEYSVRSSYIGRDRAEIALKTTLMTGEQTIRQKILGIRQLEANIKTLREAEAKNSKILDSIFKKAMSSSADRLQLRDAVLQARQSELDRLEALLGHIGGKNELAEYIGLDRLPGDQI